MTTKDQAITYMTGYSDGREWAQPSQADAQDAARYRWLAGHCRSTSEHWGGRWSIVVDGPAPKSHDSEDDFDAAIDAAMTDAAMTDAAMTDAARAAQKEGSTT